MSCVSNAAIDPFSSYVVATYSCVFKNAAIDPKPNVTQNLATTAFFENAAISWGLNAAIGPNPIAVAKKHGLNLGYGHVFKKRSYCPIAAVFRLRL